VDFPRAHEIALTVRGAFFAVGVALATVLAAGLLPSMGIDTLPSPQQRVTSGRDSRRLRTALVVGEIALAGTLCAGAQALKDEGATKVVAYITHAILSGNAIEKIMKSALDELVVTDTIPLSPEAKQCGRIRVLSVAGLLAETIRRIRDEDSVSSLYLD